MKSIRLPAIALSGLSGCFTVAGPGACRRRLSRPFETEVLRPVRQSPEPDRRSGAAVLQSPVPDREADGGTDGRRTKTITAKRKPAHCRCTPRLDGSAAQTGSEWFSDRRGHHLQGEPLASVDSSSRRRPIFTIRPERPLELFPGAAASVKRRPFHSFFEFQLCRNAANCAGG